MERGVVDFTHQVKGLGIASLLFRLLCLFTYFLANNVYKQVIFALLAVCDREGNLVSD